MVDYTTYGPTGEPSCFLVDGGRCVTDGLGNYLSNEQCTVRATAPLTLTTSEWDVENFYDKLIIHGHEYSSNGPNGLQLSVGDTIEWRSDGSVEFGGFKVGSSLLSSPPSPPPSPPALPGGTFDFDHDDGSAVGWQTGPTSPSTGSATGTAPPYGFNWRSGATPSRETGPSHGDGGMESRYYYAETSSPRVTGDVFELAYDGRACGQSSVVRAVSFAYHMLGATMGSLALVATPSGNSVWEATGEQSVSGSDWQSAYVPVHTPAFKFRAVRGANWRSDIAIDTVRVECGAPLPPATPLPPSPPAPPTPPPFPPRCGVPFDLVLVLDRSGSMGSVMSDLRDLAIELLEQIDLNRGRAGVVAFNSAAEVVSHLTGDRAALYAGIRALEATGGTRIDLGLESALAELTASGGGAGGRGI